MKRAVIVHCWGGYPDYAWYQSTKRELEAAGWAVTVPAMPDTDAPRLEQWLPVLERLAAEPDSNLYLIGHSAGVATILRYLQNLPQGVRIGGAVFVAGFLDDLAIPEIANFYENPFDFSAISSHVATITAIASDNDPYVPLNRADQLRDLLGARIIIKHHMGHFSGNAGSPGAVSELPDVARALLEFPK
jgi:predicted alpha/beta hydrolase family esterase